jgi:hypothetical protein
MAGITQRLDAGERVSVIASEFPVTPGRLRSVVNRYRRRQASRAAYARRAAHLARLLVDPEYARPYAENEGIEREQQIVEARREAADIAERQRLSREYQAKHDGRMWDPASIR